MPDGEPTITPPDLDLATENRLADILDNAGNLRDEHYRQAGDILRAHPDLKALSLSYLNRILARTIIDRPTFLTPAEQHDEKMTVQEKKLLAYSRFGKKAGEQIKLLQKTGYTDEEIKGFEKQVRQKLSWGGDTDTKYVLAAVSTMDLPKEVSDKILVRHLADRALNQREFEISARTDIELTRKQLGENYSTLMRQTVEEIVNERSTPEYRRGGLYKAGESPVGNLLGDFDRVAGTLGFTEKDIQAVKDKAVFAQSASGGSVAKAA